MSKVTLSDIPNLIEACQVNLHSLNERLLAIPEITGDKYASLATLINDTRKAHDKIFEIIQGEFKK